MSIEYQPLLEPYKYQQEVYDKSKDAEYFALFLDMGLGKTKITIDTICHLHLTQKLTRAIIVAPSGVHLNWARSQIPIHCGVPYNNHLWQGFTTKREQKMFEHLIRDKETLMFFSINAEALRTKKGLSACHSFLDSGIKSMVVIDESHIIANPSAQITKTALSLTELTDYRRILTGTPIRNHAGDLYTQVKFLSADSIPFRSYTAFSKQFLETVLQEVASRRFIPKVVGHKNREKLVELLKPFSVRLTKEDNLDLPEKIFSTVLVEMDKEQKNIYRKISEECVAVIRQEEEQQGVVYATTVLSSLTKLLQVANGFVIDQSGQVFDLGDSKLKALIQTIDSIGDKKIVIWAVFKHSIKQITQALEEAYGKGCAVQYYGDIPMPERSKVVEDFQSNPNVRFFVANRAASTGITLTAASHAIYYTNHYSYVDRIQSEDRIHRIGQKNTCVYTNLVSEDSIDERVIEICKNKSLTSERIVDQLKEVILNENRKDTKRTPADSWQL